jgi:ferredoxin
MFPKLGMRKTGGNQVVVNYAVCHFCGACVGTCPENAIFLYNSHLVIDTQACTACERCARACPLGAFTLAAGPLAIAS